jgi:putative acetyltransferase
MTTRDAGNTDLPAIRALVSRVLQEFGLVFDLGTSDADLVDLEASYPRAGGMFRVLVGETGEMIGTVGVRRDDERACSLHKMYLAKHARGRGAGKRLLEEAIDWARSAGFVTMRLETTAVLANAIALYERRGFRPVGPPPASPRCDRTLSLDL